MTSSNASAKSKKYILQNKFGSKKSVNKIWPVYVILQNYQKKLSKKSTKTATWKLVSSSIRKELSTTSIAKWNFWNQVSYITDVLATLSKFVQISRLLCMIFCRGFFENWKESGTSFQVTIFIECFDKNFSFVTLHETFHH